MWEEFTLWTWYINIVSREVLREWFGVWEELLLFRRSRSGRRSLHWGRKLNC